MTILLLIRHGMTDMVAQKRLSGRMPGVVLNDAGRREVYALAGQLALLPLQAIYSSPLDRTLQTAEIIAAPHGLTVQVREGLAETQTGEWTGKPIKELEDSEAWKALKTRPSGVRIPGGETVEEVQTRMVAEIEAIRQAHPHGLVAAVSHADPIRATLCHYLGLGLDNLQRLIISTASVTVLGFGDHGAALWGLNVTGGLDYLRRAADGEQKAHQDESKDEHDGSIPL